MELESVGMSCVRKLTIKNKKETMIHIYGIPNCNSVKKALDKLRAAGSDFTFHDFKKEGITQTKLKNWAKELTTEILVNKKGTTWRGLTPEEHAAAAKMNGALALMHEKTSIIKRPVIEWPSGIITAGFDETQLDLLLTTG